MERFDLNLKRYERQIGFVPLGTAGQKRLASASALVVGVGGLGSWAAELLTRAGIGRLRLVDDDCVELANLHRQALYIEADAPASKPKVIAAARRLEKINAATVFESFIERFTAANAATLAGGVDMVIDGTDNFATRFIINDYCVKVSLPWVMAGVVGAEWQAMTIIPGLTACLRCVYDSPAPPCVEMTCRVGGVLGPAVAMVAAWQAMEAIKILSGHPEQASPYLAKFDMWGNTFQRIGADQAAARSDCPCCKRRQFDFLDGE